jgi:hypothetical protein
MDSPPIIESLWDYGWLCRDSVKLTAAPSGAALIEQYVASPAFRTSFLPSEKDETGIHGPFAANLIKAEDFFPLQESELEFYLSTVELSEVPGEDEIQRAKLVPHLRNAFSGGRRCFVLRRDERNKELFHDWGFVIWIFREFLFLRSQGDSLNRFVIGYD